MKHRLRQNKIALMLSVSGTATSGHYIYAAKCHVKKGNYSKFQFYVWNFKIWVIPAFKQQKKKKENSFHDIKNLYKMLKYYKQRMKSVFWVSSQIFLSSMSLVNGQQSFWLVYLLNNILYWVLPESSIYEIQIKS